MLLLCALVVGSRVWAETVTYTFTAKEWTSGSGNWSGTAGSALDTKGVQCLKGTTYTVTSPSSLSNISSIVVTYGTAKSTTTSSTISIKVGDNSAVVKNVAGGSLSGSTLEWTYSQNQTGSIQMDVVPAGASVYIKSVAVTYSTDTREDSDLEITSSSPVALTMTTATPEQTSTITWTTSSGGAMAFSSNATDVATVSNTGVITAIGAGTATITISQAADDHYKASDNKTVTVNVTDSRNPVATGIDLSSAKTILKNATGSITATSTKADGFSGDITYTFETADASIFSIAEGNYTGAGVGTTTVTITATPTGGNANAYKAASQGIAVTVNGTNSISLDKTSNSVAYGAAAFSISATVPTENYNGSVSAESSNTNVATVTVNGTTVTVTPVAVGSATITVTAGVGTYYPSTASATCNVTVTAPTGKTEAPVSDDPIELDFTVNTKWGFPTTYVTGKNTYTSNGYTITLNAESNGYKFDTGSSYFIMGKEGTTLTFPAFTKPVTQIDITGRTGASSKVTQNIFVGETPVSTQTTGSTSKNEYAIASAYQAPGNIYTLKITNGNNTQITSVTIHQYQAPTATVELNKYGYATYCSEYPIDFSNTTGYTAWRVSNVASNGTITFTQITEKIKGGQGVLLYNKDADGVNKSNVTVNFADGDKEFTTAENKLFGTMALTNVAENQYYGLSGESFVKVNPGNVPAGKALLPASVVDNPEGGGSNSSGQARQLTFIFEGTQGISTVEHTALSTDDAIYSISGQRVSTPKKGLYIMNGKKVIVK